METDRGNISTPVSAGKSRDLRDIFGWGPPFRENFDLNGGCSRIRTYDPLIKSQLLYQLSYAPAEMFLSNFHGLTGEGGDDRSFSGLRISAYDQPGARLPPGAA